MPEEGRFECDGSTSLTDEQIIQRVLGGDDHVFGIIMLRYNQRLYRAARSILRDESLAEDVIQQAYINAYFHLRQYGGKSRFSTWLTRIAINEALARAHREPAVRQSASTIERAVEMVHSTAPDPERQALANELTRMIENAIDALPQPYRTVFMLREIEGLTTNQTAECLDLGRDVIKTRLLRARRRLRQALQPHVTVGTFAPFRFGDFRCMRLRARVLDRIGLR